MKNVLNVIMRLTQNQRLRYLPCDGDVSLDDWKDALLLDRRGFSESVAVDSSEDFLLQTHMIKQIN